MAFDHGLEMEQIRIFPVLGFKIKNHSGLEKLFQSFGSFIFIIVLLCIVLHTFILECTVKCLVRWLEKCASELG